MHTKIVFTFLLAIFLTDAAWAALFAPPASQRKLLLSGPELNLQVEYTKVRPTDIRIVEKRNGRSGRPWIVSRVVPYLDGGSLLVSTERGQLWLPKNEETKAKLTVDPQTEIELTVQAVEPKRPAAKLKTRYSRYVVGTSPDKTVVIFVGFSATDPSQTPTLIVSLHGGKPFEVAIKDVDYFRDGGSLHLYTTGRDEVIVPRLGSTTLKMAYRPNPGQWVDLDHRHVLPQAPTKTIQINFAQECVQILDTATES